MKLRAPLLIFFLFSLASLFGQERFSSDKLEHPKLYGKTIENSINIIETSDFKIDSSNEVALKNGLRSSTYLNPEEWIKIKDSVEIKRINIVFSKYPIRKNGYSMNHKLLFNRLKNLFSIDPYLNDSLFAWNIVLHTNCKNDKQVDSLFHGVVIEYELTQNDTDSTYSNPIALTNPISMIGMLEAIESFNDIPKEILLDLEGRNAEEKTEILVDHFESILQDTTPTPITAEFIDNHKPIIKKFIKQFSQSDDNVVFQVFDRNRQWENALIVADWTGSMYQYGAQALQWHILNFETSGLDYFTLFNDGDMKSTRQKILGETKGIYFEKADNIDKVIDLYQLVMLKGGGGDGPENDIEGVIEGIDHYPMHSEVILIADNNACVRDISLLEYIDEPIRVILCGYNDRTGINPQYIHIAKESGGSLHTIEQDIYNLEVELTRKGEIKTLLDYDYKIGSSNCYYQKSIYPDSYYENKIYYDLDSAKRDRKKVMNLDLSSQSLKKVPRQIKKFKSLQTLDLSDNQISKIPRPLYNSYYIETLDLSKNTISSIPSNLSRLKKIKRLDLSDNNINSIESIPRFNYLTHLNLSNNNLKELPINIYLRSLKRFYISNNELIELPVSIGRLKKLEELTLNGNSLSSIPKKIVYLRKLKVLDISENNISELPVQIKRLKKLEKLILNGNNFSNEYIEYLREILPNTIIENQ